MFQSIDDFLRYFRSVHKRALRDVGSLPPAADGWTPAGGEGENAWSINTVVGHIAGSRLYFASAYRREGWINPSQPKSPPATSGCRSWSSPTTTSWPPSARRRLSSSPARWT